MLRGEQLTCDNEVTCFLYMNVLCLDFGLKRIGVAVGSTESGIAFPRDILRNDASIFKTLKFLIEQEKIKKIIVGMPLKRDGAAGDIEESLEAFVNSLKEFQLPVDQVDERYTSKIAQRLLSDFGMKVKDQKQISDSIAAQVMLQEWFERS